MKKKRAKFAAMLKKAGYSAYKMSIVLGYKDRSTVRKWIYGDGQPSAGKMLMLKDLLDVSAEEILRAFAESETEQAEE